MKRLILETGSLALLAAIAALVTWKACPSKPANPYDVNVAWVQAHGPVQWVDARSAADFGKGHARGAWNLNPGNVEAAAFDFFEKAQALEIPVVIYCAGAACDASHHVRDVMAGWGLQQEPKALAGGWPAYMESGLPTE